MRQQPPLPGTIIDYLREMAVKLPAMKKVLLLLAIVLCACKLQAQQIPAWSAGDIMARVSSPDTVYVFNFWATWCIPCVQELPEFNGLQDRYHDKPVKIILVSLDFKEDYPQKLASFAERKRLKPQVAWLSDTDPNVFIPKIEQSWEGSIPATLIIRPGSYRKFIEGQITTAQVAGLIDGAASGK